MALSELLRRDAEALAFYELLHPSVRQRVDERASEIVLDEDLYALANNAMSESLQEFGGVFDDSETWPD